MNQFLSIIVTYKIYPLGKYMFVEYSWNIPMIYPRNIRKGLPMNFREIFTNNVPGILKIGIFPECSMNILGLLHVFFRWIMEL